MCLLHSVNEKEEEEVEVEVPKKEEEEEEEEEKDTLGRGLCAQEGARGRLANPLDSVVVVARRGRG